eukprot:1621894-Karenia_brevis.AAC.1
MPKEAKKEEEAKEEKEEPKFELPEKPGEEDAKAWREVEMHIVNRNGSLVEQANLLEKTVAKDLRPEWMPNRFVW